MIVEVGIFNTFTLHSNQKEFIILIKLQLKVNYSLNLSNYIPSYLSQVKLGSNLPHVQKLLWTESIILIFQYSFNRNGIVKFNEIIK